MGINTTTPFYFIYDSFLSKITDDLYLEMTKEDTYADLQTILINAIPAFEFPKFPIFSYELIEYMSADGVGGMGFFNSVLTREEVDIVSDLMVMEWIKRQIASVENTRMKYSGSDFKFTSQANHLDKLLKTGQSFNTGNKHKQRLYKRRSVDPNTGIVRSSWGGLAGGGLNRGN